MPNFKNLFSFHKFPVNKPDFFGCLEALTATDADVAALFSAVPSLYDQIYITVSDKDLQLVGNRLGDTGVVKTFKECDAFFNVKHRYIILHVPSMVSNLAAIPTREDDPQRRVLFTIHFFGCLFHELAAAAHASGCLADKTLSLASLQTPYYMEVSTKHAEQREGILLDKLNNFLHSQNLSWTELAETIFNWDKLHKYVPAAIENTAARN